MKNIHVRSTIQSYDIVIGNHIRHHIKDQLDKNYSSILIITDSNVGKLYAQDIHDGLNQKNIFIEIVDAGEQSKNIETFYNLHTKAIEYGLDRQSLIIALGGGVIGDLAGFVAATYMRGIDFIQVPTTLLAHDSSVGGKVAINHDKGKNLIGSFYPPVLVLYDTDTLQTLPPKEIRSGYAELIKEAMLSDSGLWNKLLSQHLDRITPADLEQFLEMGIKIKAEIVQQDERESGVRKFLNLGHTLGHAIEADLGYGVLTHGEAVAIGLLFAFYVSEQELQAVLPIQELRDWLKRNEYPFLVNTDRIDELIDLMKRDKKTEHNQIQMVLLNKIGDPVTHIVEENKLKNYLTSFVEREIING
ncbi:3-dehydroquinate synthase [Ornithinibacillus sp. BX22]|uniref:3-dehydroquinate synthase n=2 Tax=Ornithinibacillus TaxID=484508 RepID=A0A923L5Y6_9BACI|nr:MULTISPECIES: 3-dehydroquinate synthase [Ornithinibacillus]MBC5637067.1 3-dehydroquinate synthase [Ornithinibacillus hominis]MBS3679722.1 3-dehydroquinate synthase [Ornithinibacillus massiliensis]